MSKMECPYLLEFESFEPGRCALKDVPIYCNTCEKCKEYENNAAPLFSCCEKCEDGKKGSFSDKSIYDMNFVLTAAESYEGGNQ